MNRDRRWVHAAHCCKKHGCKYSEYNCPVVNGEVEQNYPYVDCYSDYSSSAAIHRKCRLKNLGYDDENPEWCVGDLIGLKREEDMG